MTVNTASRVISSVPRFDAGHRRSRVMRVDAVGLEQSFSHAPGKRGYGNSAEPSDRTGVLRAAVVGQYVRMAQHMGGTTPLSTNLGGIDPPAAEGVTKNLQRDMLQTFLEHMGGLKSADTGSYVSLRA